MLVLVTLPRSSVTGDLASAILHLKEAEEWIPLFYLQGYA
jgi:hypothetical protein